MKGQRAVAWSLGLIGLAIAVAPARGQSADGAPPVPTEAAGPASRPSLHDLLFDEEDGKLDLSNFLARGGFVPMPVIITEPAVDGGFGLVAQFVRMDPQHPRRVTRRMIGAVKTGNGSYGIGYFQSGQAFDGRLSYKAGAGTGKITIRSFPSFLPGGLQYTNHYDFAALASAQWHLADDRFSFGPLVDVRRLRTSVAIEGLPDDLPFDFNNKLFFSALGFGVHFDGRDNKLTPRNGLNAYGVAKFNSSAFGSDRTFQIYELNGYGFRELSPRWRLGAKVETTAIRGKYPIYFARSINLRGVEAQRYQGVNVVSTEVELTHTFGRRGSVLAFAGLGGADAGSSRLFDDSGLIFTGGGGFRYKLARKMGLDVGVDVAAGPGGVIFYLQFGHAWSMGMD